MTGYDIPADDTSMDFQYWLDYAIDHERHTPPTMQPCKHVDCLNSSLAIFCSESCRIEVEGDDTEDYDADRDSAFYTDGQGVALGNKILADTQWQADQAAGGFAAMVCGVQPQAPAAVAPTFTEAPISITLKGLVHGQDTMITIRGTDFASVQAQLDAACAWFDVPVAQGPAQSPPVEPGEGWCAIHATQMRWNPAKGGEAGWWSHKAADGSGWCKGRGKGGRS